MAYHAGIMKRIFRQYTIRSIPVDLDRALRARARAAGVSLNQAALDALALGVGLVREPRKHVDLDWIIGSWVEDPEFDRALAAQDEVDEALWQ